jgi:hypothetical protein
MVLAEVYRAFYQKDPFGQAATRFLYPTIQGSVAEAVFALGMQRNGDLLLGTSYAPYLSVRGFLPPRLVVDG